MQNILKSLCSLDIMESYSWKTENVDTVQAVDTDSSYSQLHMEV